MSWRQDELMRFETAQHMRLSQQMKLAPRMIQSMEILQMPLLQLEERIEQELESNVTLEIADGSVDGDADGSNDGDQPRAAERDSDADPISIDERNSESDFARLETFERSNPEAAENEFSSPAERNGPAESYEPEFRSTRLAGEPDAKSEAMANTASRSASLLEQLRDQWALVDVEESLHPLGEHIVSFIEDDGYLRTPLETIIDRMPEGARGGVTVEQAERALRAVQLLLDPPGVGARDERECLLLQIDAIEQESRADDDGKGGRGELGGLGESGGSGGSGGWGGWGGWGLVRRIVDEHLEDLAQNRLPKVAEGLGVSIEAVKSATERMRHLSLAPARQLVDDPPEVIIPDAIVEYDVDEDRYVAYLNDSRLPNLRVNQEYARISKDRQAPRETREFIKKNLSNANWLIEAVEQRKKTLLRVINVVVDAQREYFDEGPQALRPLPMTQVADQLGVHVATVSRAVSEKYLFTPRGVVPLRSFFSGGTQTESGEDVSWDAIKAALKELVEAEDKAKPLSDEALAKQLKERGINIARRTVAKYRDQLDIPAARLRKRY